VAGAALAVRVVRILLIGGTGVSSLTAAATSALRGNPTFEARTLGARGWPLCCARCIL
jgi:hypothetical protein